MTTTITPECKITYATSITHDIEGSKELVFGWYATKVLGETSYIRNNSRYIGFTTNGSTCWYKFRPTSLKK